MTPEVPSEITEQELDERINKIKSRYPPMPPRVSYKKLTLVIDLDNTILSSTPTYVEGSFQYFKGMYTVLRPGVTKMLQSLSPHVEIIVYTAGTREYANAIVKVIDPFKLYIQYVLSRNETVPIDNCYFKFLEIIDRPLHTIVMIDDRPECVVPATHVLPTPAFYGTEIDSGFFDRVIYIMKGLVESID